jgi:ferredoxin
MVRLKIDNTDIQVPEGTTVLEAAHQAGIEIPSMCYKGGHENHPSCMICLVKDKKTGNLTTSCALPVAEGMELLSNDPQVTEARKEALELLMSDHVGDCEAPCSLACPANMNIPLMNRLIAARKFKEAMHVVKKDIALPYVLGYICPAPCEKACRRKQVDDAVSVCLLKRSVADNNYPNVDDYLDHNQTPHPPTPLSSGDKSVAIIGSGPAGLAAAYYLLTFGYTCVVFDKNEKAGGALQYSIPDDELPKKVLDEEIEIIRKLGAEFRLNTPVTKENFEPGIRNKFNAVIIATGDVLADDRLMYLFDVTKNGIAAEEGTLRTSETGIFACGSVIRAQKMAVRAVAQGKAAAVSAHRYLQGKPLEKPERPFNSRFDKLMPEEYSMYLHESVPDTRHAPQEGMLKGFSKDEAVREAMRCMHCDCRKLESCKLRQYAGQYKIDRKKYQVRERKRMTRDVQHENVVYEPAKCIKCGLCIDITLKNNELTGLTYIGRGFDVRIDASLGTTLDKALTHTARRCVDTCPTGALAIKNDGQPL